VADSIISENSASEGGAIANSFGFVLIDGSTLANNRASDPESNGGWGGGISNYQGSVYVQFSTLNNNFTPYTGGGIYNHQGSLSIFVTTLSGNKAGWGGGIRHLGDNTLIIDSSTLSHNSADNDGGGLYIDGELISINSTFSGNTANSGGGIFANSGAVNLSSKPISDNSAVYGGGVYIYSSLNFSNTLIANSIKGGDCYVWLEGTGSIGTNAHNLVGDGSCSNGGTKFLSGDAKLGPLANNGGPTQTHALLTDSPAIDARNCALAENFDQRGQPRPSGSACDIGAFEFNPALDGFKFIFLPLIIR